MTPTEAIKRLERIVKVRKGMYRTTTRGEVLDALDDADLPAIIELLKSAHLSTE